MTLPYSLKVVDAAGTTYGTLIGATNVRPVWELNGPGSLDFDIQTVDAGAALCIPTQREVQLWYDDGVAAKALWWGPIWDRECQGVQTHVQCRGLLSYTERIQMGPILNNYLTDPDFEDATLAAWTAVGATKTSETTIVRKGTRSMKLVSASPGLDQFAYQQFTVNNSLGTEPVAIFVRARFYCPAATFTGPALQERGLFVQTIESAVVQEAVWRPLTNAGPFSQWVRIFAPPISVPAGHTQTVEVRCYSPGGPIYWDTSIGAVDESTGANTANSYADVNAIIGNVLAYGQDTGSNKTNWHLAGPSGTLGVTLERQFQFYNHGFVWPAALKPLIDAGVCDIDVTWNATTPTTRTVQTYTTKGSTPGVTLTLGSNADISSYPQDGTVTAGAITVLPQSMNQEVTLGTVQPAADDVAYAADTSANGGYTLDEVISAVPESTLDQMASQATTELARRKTLVSLPVFTAKASAIWAAGVRVGDTVVFNGTFGWVSESSVNRRVMAMALFPEKDLIAITGK